MPLLYNTERKAYVAIDSRSRTTLTTNPERARRFTEEAARNILNNQLRATRHDYRIIPDLSEEKATTIVEDRCEPDIVPLSQNPWLKKAIDELNAQLQQCDLQISDIYHYAYIHPSLPANKGYKLYRLLREVCIRRAKIKIQMNAIESCTEVRKPYTPRTELYEKLDAIL